jgi:phosphoesterase RecJ-like protein
MRKAVENFQAFLESNKHIIITSHRNPDGDSIGSEIGLYWYLKEKGKNVHIFNSDETPHNLQFLDPEKNIKIVYDESDIEAEGVNPAAFNLIILDCKGPHRTGRAVENLIVPHVKDVFVIDHHITEQINHNEIIRIDLIATCEILYHVIVDYFGDNINLKSAQALYTGIYTDSGAFSFPRTTSKTFQIVSRLVDLGVDPTYIFRSVRQKETTSKIKVIGRILDGIKYYHDERIAVLKATHKDVQDTGASFDEIEGGDMVNFPLIAEKTQISVFIRETKGNNNEIKISLRSKADYDVRKVAIRFGGGGHLNACGFRSFMPLKELEKKVVEELSDIL